MRIEVDVSKCVGAGQCVLTAPQVFTQRDEDCVVDLLDENPPAGFHDAVREAAVLCPADVIRLVDQ